MTWIKNNQQKVALLIGYFLVASLFYNLGKYRTSYQNFDISVEEPAIDLSRIQNTLNSGNLQLPGEEGSVAGTGTENNCARQIKGNIGSSGKIYHMPGGAFYDRTNAELCFNTEQEAQAAGFRRSSR